MIQETRLRVASNHTHGWQANIKTHLCVACSTGLCPKRKNHPLCGWILITNYIRCRVISYDYDKLSISKKRGVNVQETEQTVRNENNLQMIKELRLMHDFNCKNAEDIVNPLLAEEVRELSKKQTA